MIPRSDAVTEAFPARTPQEQHMVLRQFLFSVTPGRRVPPIATKQQPAKYSETSDAGAVGDAVSNGNEDTTAVAAAGSGSNAPQGGRGASSALDKKLAAEQRMANDEQNARPRVTVTHAQELLAVSRALRGDAGDRPANRPLQVGTLPDRCKELLQYYDRCHAAAERARRYGLSDDDVPIGAPRVQVSGLVRGVKKRLQTASRTYSTERADYVSLAAYQTALESEEVKAKVFVGAPGSRQARAGHSASRDHRKKAGPPVLQSTIRAQMQSSEFDANLASQPKVVSHVTADEAVIEHDAAVVDLTRRARFNSPSPQLDDADPAGRRVRLDSAALDESRSGSPPDGRRRSSVSSPRASKALRRARGEVAESKVSSLGAAVLSAEAETIEILRCETYPERHPEDVTAPASPTANIRRPPSPQNDVRGNREFSRRTCVHDERRPRSFAQVLRDRFLASEFDPAERKDADASRMSEAGDSSAASKASAAALRLRLPTMQTGAARPATPSSLDEALRRQDLPSGARGRAAMQALVASQRRAATPSISQPRASTPAARAPSARLR